MAVSTVKLNGVTLMTVNDTTSVASDVAQGKYFYGADGVKHEGANTITDGNNLSYGEYKQALIGTAACGLTKI